MLISLFAYQLLNSRLENLHCANINIQQAFAQNLTLITGMQTEKLALINPCGFDVCELVPQFTVHRSKEQEKLHNIVELEQLSK